MNNLLPILYIVGLYSAFLAGSLFLRASSSTLTSNPFQYARTTLLLTFAIAIPSVLQFFFPVILSIFERDYTLFLSGDWWRLITPLFVQDGGLTGTFFNLVTLFLVGSVAEQLWGGRYMLVIFFVGGIAAEIVAFAWQPVGAGNSVGNFSLAAGIAVACFTRRPQKPVLFVAIFALFIYGILFGLRDIHGAAAITGEVVAFVLSQVGSAKISD